MKKAKLSKISLYLVFVITLIAIIVIYSRGYIHEVHMAKALPISMILGASLIAIAMYES